MPGPAVKPRPAALCEASLHIGTGRQTFVPLVDGDGLDVVKGATQGWFFTLSVQARGIDPAHASVCYRGTLYPDGRELGFQCWKAQFVTALGDGWHERLGLMAVLYPDFWNHPAELDGRDVRLEVYVGDDSECTVTGQVFAQLQLP